MQDNMLSVKVMFFSMLGAVSFLVGGCGGIPPEMVAEQIQGVSIKIQAVSNQSESLTEAENYLRQAKDAQLNKYNRLINITKKNNILSRSYFDYDFMGERKLRSEKIFETIL